MRGYKAVNQDMTCRGFRYEVGKTYRTDEPIVLCENGFHFCKQISGPFEFYDKDARLFEVEASGEIIEGVDKCVCSDIRLISEITGQRKTLAMYGDGDGYGYGYGYNNGYGYSDGGGYGYGYNNGDGYGRGYGYGHNNGDGYGDGDGENMQKILTIVEVEE